VVVGTLAKAYKSFLLAAVSVALEVVSTKFAAVSCCRTVVSLAAARARLSRAVPKRSMETAVCVTETPVGVGHLQSRDSNRIARVAPAWSLSY
jgi:hypothetical protein